MRHVYQVGDKILHEAFGEGLVVDVRQRPFYDILEVAFSDGVRKITSIHPQIQPGDSNGAPKPRKKKKQKVDEPVSFQSRPQSRRSSGVSEPEHEPKPDLDEIPEPAITFENDDVIQPQYTEFRLALECHLQR